MAYGQWLRTEVREHSPYWQAFYQTPERVAQNEETVPETPPTLLPSVTLLPKPHSANEVTSPVSANRPQHDQAAPQLQLPQTSQQPTKTLTTALIPATRLEMIAQVLWQIWCMRNNWIFRHKRPDLDRAIEDAIVQHRIQNTPAQRRTRSQVAAAETGHLWRPPDRGQLKCNIDGSYHPSNFTLHHLLHLG